MIKSMTGYGSARKTFGTRTVSVELRSVNHRYFDCHVRLPRIYIACEEPIKAQIGQIAGRGKIDVFVNIEDTGGAVAIRSNRPVLEAYLAELIEMRASYGLKGDIDVMALARFPEVFTVEKPEEDADQIQAQILQVLDEALDEYMQMCTAEGEKLCEAILSQVEAIEAGVAFIAERGEAATAQYRERLLARMREVLDTAGIDESRILTEAALYADRSAVNEETVRLTSHIGQLRTMLKNGGAVGRKLDFLIQEFNREVNTIGSKANDLEITREVVNMKANIEKIREQIQNIE
ncbi:YicC family protein [Oscillospiraceae bacterium OttesenSCG-928-F05]|nr:YicC family protein [Oscillospiraceae bacterium OttesenSCG-928-F05]